MLPPLFMWAGGKRKMLRHFQPLLPNIATLPFYVEPFLGGGAMFAYLAQHRPTLPAWLSDTNGELIRMLAHVRKAPDSMLAKIQALDHVWQPLSLNERRQFYYQQRAYYWGLDPQGQDAAATLLFLMRTGFNGIWQTCVASQGKYATPVGLANQQGPVLAPSTLLAWSRALKEVTLVQTPYEGVVVPKGAFVYCDPPYRASFADYGAPFDDAAQARLVAWCQQQAIERQALVWLSNRDIGDGFFSDLAPQAQAYRFPVTYTAGRRKRESDGGFSAKPATEILLIWDGRIQ